MKAIFYFFIAVLMVGVFIIYKSSRDILDISSKSGLERQDAIVEIFEQRLLKLESDYFQLREKITVMTAEEREQYAQLGEQIESLESSVDELEDTRDEVRWKILSQRFVDRYNYATKFNRQLERVTKKRK
jgi:DNA replication initiation complex subunit (GINS family)